MSPPRWTASSLVPFALLVLSAAPACSGDVGQPLTGEVDPGGEEPAAGAPGGGSAGPSAALAALDGARAHWLRPDLIAVPADFPGASFALHYAPGGGLAIEGGALVGGL